MHHRIHKLINAHISGTVYVNFSLHLLYFRVSFSRILGYDFDRVPRPQYLLGIISFFARYNGMRETTIVAAMVNRIKPKQTTDKLASQ